MTHVCIGIPVRERLDFLDSTLEALKSNTASATTVVLADGLSATDRARMVHPRCDDVITWDRILGDAACFNRLVMAHVADVYVLLENGARVAPHWLDRLLSALAAGDSHGLAGPSTNRSWNEQQQFTDCSGSAADLVRAGDEAARKYGDALALLTPLHSLGDFCYVVRRKVIDCIGAADDAYADGPCWEMDYNIRAARAGFPGVWAKSAYVWRAPETARRQATEKRRFDLNKRRYQDHFCGLRLRHESMRYDAHCTGDACEHFAPAELIVTRREFAAAENVAAPLAPGQAQVPHARPPLTSARTGESKPLVSCIMPTANRRQFVPRAIEAFLDQDYEPRELIILDDGTESIEDLVPVDDRIRYVRNTQRQNLGNKRNAACRLARGEIIVHWDDDDWHAHWRLSYQVGELLACGADICGLNRLWFYEEGTRRAWQYRYPGGRSRWLAGGSFCYRRRLWERQPFTDVAVGEDTRFVRAAAFAKLLTLERDDFYVARVHGGNTCRKQTSGPSWYAASHEAVEKMIERGRKAEVSEPLPLISCIMPTYNRPSFVALGLQRFTEQVYPNKELIVIDDGTEPVEALVSMTPNARYLRMQSRCTIGEKRNAACQMAQGDIIAQWDDDDWYGPRRLEHQAAPLLCDRADITGLRCRWLMTLPEGAFWQISEALHRRMFVHDLHGGTLLFRKQIWERGARYPHSSLAEDAALVRAAVERGARVEVVENFGDFVYSRHGQNAWRFSAGQFLDARQWQRTHQPAALDDTTLASYRNACATAAARATSAAGPPTPHRP